jgi:hypothetical protein
VGYFCVFSKTVQSKQSSIGRKFTAERPDDCVKKIAPNIAQHFFCQNLYITFSAKNTAKLVVYVTSQGMKTIAQEVKIRPIWSPCPEYRYKLTFRNDLRPLEVKLSPDT